MNDSYDFSSIKSILEPRSVAIVGASDSPNRIGGRSLAYMLKRSFDGDLYPINPQRQTVQGLRSYCSIADLPASVDTALVALPANLVPNAIDDLILNGVSSAVIFSSGFAEVGVEGAKVQADIAAKAKDAGMRLLGPNSLGLINTRRNFWGTFTSALEANWPEIGRVGIASQSGAYGSHILSLAMARGMGISSFVTTGNEADITTTDAIGWMAQDNDTDVIIAYLEGIQDSGKLAAALEMARLARKPVIVMKAGSSALGSIAAQSHTASLAGNDAVTDAVLREYGALRITNTQQALDFAEAACTRIYPVQNSLGVLTVSGGAGILIADDAERFELPMPEMPQEAQQQLIELLSFAATRNPVDCTAQAFNQIELIGDFGVKLVEAGGYKSLLIFLSHAGGHTSTVPALREQLKRIRDIAPDCLCVLSLIASQEVTDLYRQDGFLVFDDPSRAVAAIAAMGRLGQGFARIRLPRPSPLAHIKALESVPNEKECKTIFAAAGIASPVEYLVNSEEEAALKAHDIGFPIVMKIVSPDIPHKTEIGGVLIGVDGEEKARTGYTTLIERAQRARPNAKIDGILVAQQIDNGVECLMGIQCDPVFGPIAVFGLGGIFVEIMQDVVLRQCPFGEVEAEEMIRSIKGFELLNGARGTLPVDIPSLAAMLSRLSTLAMALGPNLQSIDINPVIATPNGAWAVDGLIDINLNQGIKNRKSEDTKHVHSI